MSWNFEMTCPQCDHSGFPAPQYMHFLVIISTVQLHATSYCAALSAWTSWSCLAMLWFRLQQA